MKKLFGNTVRKLSVSSSSTTTSSAFNLRRLSVHSNNSSTLNALQIKVLRGGYNIDLDKVDASFTKLHKAVYLNNEEKVVKYLAEAGVATGTGTGSGKQSSSSSSSGKKHSKPKHNVNALDSCSRSVLHLAAINGNLRIIRLLLAAGANVNVQDSDGRTPMMKAVECGHTDVLQLLLETAGADVDLADREKGNTALHTALIGANLDCALYIIRNALIIDYNKRNHKKETFLHLAAKIGDLFLVIEELIANGIEIEATDELGRTAAQIAQLHGNEEAFRVITKYATAKAQPAMPMSSAAEDQLSASVHLMMDGPGSYENISAMQQHQHQHQHHSNPYQHHPPPISRTTSRNSSNSKLSASDSFASNASSKSGGGSHNFLRFSGLFEETILEENKKDSSTSSSSTNTTANGSSPNKPTTTTTTERGAMERSESIYENYHPSSEEEAFMPPPRSANVIRRKKQGSPAAAVAAAIIGSSVSVEEEMLSDELSELDAMLVSNIGINAESLSGRQQQQQMQQQQRRSSTTVLLNDSPSVVAVTTNGHVSSPLSPVISAQSASSTANGYHHLSATRATRPKAQWLELLEEKEVTVLEHTEVLQAVITTTSSSLPNSTANSTTTTTHSVFTFNTVPTVSTAAATAAANAGTASRCSAGQTRESSPLNRELGNQSASLPASSALSGPVSPTSPALAATENSRENSVLTSASPLKGRSTNSGQLSVHAQPFHPRQSSFNNGSGNGKQQQQQPALSLSYAQVASFSPQKRATIEQQQPKSAITTAAATSPPLSPPPHASQKRGGNGNGNGGLGVIMNGFASEQSPAAAAAAAKLLNNGSSSLPTSNGMAINSAAVHQQQQQQQPSPVRRGFGSPRGSVSSSCSNNSGSSSSYHHHLQHNDFDRSRASRHSMSGGIVSSATTTTNNNHRATLNFAQQMMAGSSHGSSPYHQLHHHQQQQQQPLTTTFSYAQLVANQSSSSNGGGGGGSLGRNIAPPNVFNGVSPSTKQLKVDSAVQTEVQELEPSGAAKYESLLQSVERLLTCSSNSAANILQRSSSTTTSISAAKDGHATINGEMATLKRLSGLVYEANHNTLELEYKRKEVALLKATTESLQAQLEHEQTLKRQFEGRLKKLLNPTGGRRGSLMLLNGSGGVVLGSESVDWGAATSGGGGGDHLTSVIKQYETALRTSVAENASLREELEATREAYLQLQFEIGTGSAHTLLNGDSSGSNEVAVSNSATVENNNNDKSHLLTAAELGHLLTQLDTKLTSLTETLTASSKQPQQQQQQLQQQKITTEESDRDERTPEGSAVQRAESFTVEQLRDEIAGLKEMMIFHLLAPAANNAGSAGNDALISSDYHHHLSTATSLTPSTQAALLAILDRGESPRLMAAAKSNTNNNHAYQAHTRRHSDFEQRLRASNVNRREKESGDDKTEGSSAVPEKQQLLLYNEHDRLSPRKSFSLHDLVSLSSVDDALSSQGANQGANHPLELSKVDLAARKSYDDHLQLQSSGHGSGTTGSRSGTADAQSRKTAARSNLQADYSNSFSYKSKYFQSKINELRKQLGIAQ